MTKGLWLAVAGLSLMALTAPTTAGAAPEIPAKFHGAGCNLKYTYARTPKGQAIDCFNAKADYKAGDGHDNDNFIRITKNDVSGVEWGCTVKAVKSADDAEFTFAGTCGGEGMEEYPSTVTLLLRPGRLVIVDQVVEGRHIIDVYRLSDALE